MQIFLYLKNYSKLNYEKHNNGSSASILFNIFLFSYSRLINPRRKSEDSAGLLTRH